MGSLGIRTARERGPVGEGDLQQEEELENEQFELQFEKEKKPALQKEV